MAKSDGFQLFVVWLRAATKLGYDVKCFKKKCKWVHHEKQMKGVFGDVDQERKMSSEENDLKKEVENGGEGMKVG